MTPPTYPLAIVAAEAPARTKASNDPEPFASRMAGRRKQPLGDVFGRRVPGRHRLRPPEDGTPY